MRRVDWSRVAEAHVFHMVDAAHGQAMTTPSSFSSIVERIRQRHDRDLAVGEASLVEAAALRVLEARLLRHRNALRGIGVSL